MTFAILNKLWNKGLKKETMRIVVGVSGSISAYKALDVVRGFVKGGHEVKVVMTSGSLEFVVPKVFLYLGAKEVFGPKDDFDSRNSVLHIDLANWAEKLIILPLSANTLSSLSHGMANDLLTCIFLALPQETPVLLYPAMNTKMLNHSLVKENLNRLTKLSQVLIVPPEKGILACGEEGEGKLPDVETIIETAPFVKKFQNKNPKSILITTGATLSPLDPVRYLTNSSSGLTGLYLARQALSEGHRVTVIAGKTASSKLEFLNIFEGYQLFRVVTPSEMKKVVFEHIHKADVYISSAAIGDIEFPQQSEKLKKTNLEESLSIQKSPDILGLVLKNKPSTLKTVGFAAETNLTPSILEEKWDRKPVDLLIGTKVNNGLTDNEKLQGFSNHEAEYSFMEKRKITFKGPLPKDILAKKILQRCFT